MPFDRILIAPISTGLQTDLKPFLIPDDAYARLQNAYVFRGRTRKRFGSIYTGSGATTPVTEQLFSRLRINIGTTNGSGNLSGTAPGVVFKAGQAFSIGNTIYTVPALGTPVIMLDTSGTTTTKTYNTTSGAYVFAGAAINTIVYFYPSEPVMGLTTYEVGPINNQPAYGFDTQFAYVFSGGSWNRSGTVVWHGDDLNFFWTANWEGVNPNDVALYVTNFNATVPVPAVTDDPIYYFDGTNWTALTTPVTIFNSAGDFIFTSRIIVQFQNRLLLLNTVEQLADKSANKSYVNRCRYSHLGSPLSANAWLELGQVNGGNKGDGGGFVDATTEEAIISAEFIKDRLIVYFERSTWELAYTGNQVKPFVWQKINTELGSEAQQSTVPFDQAIFTIGSTGVHSCNGANVQRIDIKIPDLVFDIVNKDIGVQRVAGIRDYFTELVYWTFPEFGTETDDPYPTKVLVFNYRTGSWAINDDSITAFGYLEQQMDTTWESSAPLTWQEANMTWDSGIIEAQFRQVIAGNQEGYVFIINPDVSRNASVLQITNIVASGDGANLTIVDHNLGPTDYIIVENALGITVLNGLIFKIDSVIDADTVHIVFQGSIPGTYTGGGVAGRVSVIDILTKQFNPYLDKGQDVYIHKVDFGVMATTDGEILVDYYPSSTELSMVDEGGATGTNMLMGTNVLETSPYPDIPIEAQQTRLWHPVYFQTQGECIQLNMYLSDEQVREPDIAFSDFQMEGMIIYCQPTGRLQ